MADDAPPPSKRMRLRPRLFHHRDPNRENLNPQNAQYVEKPDVRRRKKAIRRTHGKHIFDLNPHVMLDVLQHLSIEDLCNLAESSRRMREMAQISFIHRANHGLTINRDIHFDWFLMIRLLDIFGPHITSISLSSRR